MLKYIKKFLKVIVELTVLFLFLIIVITALNRETISPEIGGIIHEIKYLEDVATQTVFKENLPEEISDRFQRPSKQLPYNLKYSFRDFEDKQNKDLIFKDSEDLIQAYYAILKEASNMIGYYGGCGSIGQGDIPYPYAYELMSSSTKEIMSLDKFINSFEGIGHITLLKLLPAYNPPETPDNIKYYMVEIEVLTSAPRNDGEVREKKPSYFAYYYGLITTEFNSTEGWKIKSIDYIPEDFLCAPYHHWYWEAKGIVEIIYGSWYKLVDNIDRIEKKDSLIHIYASGNNKEYRFDFVRLTNGEDLLLHEYIKQNDEWKEVNILNKDHQFYKLSIMTPRIN